jgi:hypothetical protein
LNYFLERLCRRGGNGKNKEQIKGPNQENQQQQNKDIRSNKDEGVWVIKFY